MDNRGLREHDYGVSCAIGALITAMGMMAENMQRVQRGESVVYVADDFEKLMEQNSLHHNGVLTRWEGIL